MGRSEKEVVLNRQGVTDIIADLEKWLKKTGSDKVTSIRIRFTMEELLLRICEHFDEKVRGVLVIGKRFGNPVFKFRYEADSYDPVSDEKYENHDDISGDFISGMLEKLGLKPRWTYRYGVNELTLICPSRTSGSMWKIMTAAFLSVVLGLSSPVIPTDIKLKIADYVMTPVSNAFTGALGTFVGLMIFLCAVNGICSVGDLREFSRMGTFTTRRFISQSFIGTAIATAVLIPFFTFGKGETTGGTSQIQKLIELVFGIIPRDPVSPFITGNMLQIIFMGVIIGTSLLVLGQRSASLRKAAGEAGDLLNYIVDVICKFLPIYILTSLTGLIWKNGLRRFIPLWKPLVLFTVLAFVYLLAKLIMASVKVHVSPVKIFSYIVPSVLTGLFTASSTIAFSNMSRINEKKLGIRPDFNRFALPFGNLLCGSTSGPGLIVIIYFLAEFYEIPADLGWFVTAGLICAVLGMAMPPVSGGMMIGVGIAMAQLDITSEGLAMAGILGIITDFTMTASKVGITHLELLIQADYLGALDDKMLRNRN